MDRYRSHSPPVLFHVPFLLLLMLAARVSLLTLPEPVGGYAALHGS